MVSLSFSHDSLGVNNQLVFLSDSSDDGVVSVGGLFESGVFSIKRGFSNSEVVLGGLELLFDESNALFESSDSSFKVRNDGVGEEIDLLVEVIDTSLESISGRLELSGGSGEGSVEVVSEVLESLDGTLDGGLIGGGLHHGHGLEDGSDEELVSSVHFRSRLGDLLSQDNELTLDLSEGESIELSIRVVGLSGFELINSLSDDILSLLVFNDFSVVEVGEFLELRLSSREVRFILSKVSLVSGEFSAQSILLGVLVIEVSLFSNDLSTVLGDISLEESNGGIMETSLTDVKIILRLLSVKEVGFKSIESIEEVFVVVSKLGSKGDHILKGSSEVGFFHRFVDSLNQKLGLGSLGGDGEDTLHGDCDNKEDSDDSHFVNYFLVFYL